MQRDVAGLAGLHRKILLPFGKNARRGMRANRNCPCEFRNGEPGARPRVPREAVFRPRIGT